jgi:hypothetical protein
VQSAKAYTSKLDEALCYRWSDSQTMRIVTWAIVLFIIFYLATEPTSSGNLVHHAYNGVHYAAESLATFVNSL